MYNNLKVLKHQCKFNHLYMFFVGFAKLLIGFLGLWELRGFRGWGAGGAETPL